MMAVSQRRAEQDTVSRLRQYDTGPVRTGNRGSTTSGRRDRERTDDATSNEIATIAGVVLPPFAGHPHGRNPEQLLMAARARYRPSCSAGP